MSPFKKRVISIIQSIPKGKVMSYGQVAVYAGVPRAARQVGWILHGSEKTIELPWWRVVNNKGYLSIRGGEINDKKLQQKLLLTEDVPVNDDFLLPIEKYRYQPSKKIISQFELPKEYIEFLVSKYGL